MTSNPAGTTHAAMVEQLFEEARSAERSDEPDMAARLREAARLIEGVDLYGADGEFEGRLALYGGSYYRVFSVQGMEKGGSLLRLCTVAEDPEAPVITQLIDGADVQLVDEAPQPQHSYVDDYHA